MLTEFGMTCPDCHGTLEDVGNKLEPWLEEPRCDSPLCHGTRFAQDSPLYRLSREHGGMFCEACHDSAHAIALSREPKDGIKFLQLQGYDGTLRRCTVCHVTQPADAGPHGLTGPMSPAWEKEIWSQGVIVQPAGNRVLVVPGGSVDVVDHVQVSGDLSVTFAMNGAWTDGMSLTAYEADAGSVATGAQADTLVWNVTGELADTWHTLTRTWSISTTPETRMWLTDTLVVAGGSQPVVRELVFQPGTRVYLPLVFRSGPE